MFDSRERFYRYRHQARAQWQSFQVVYRETDLWIRATRDLKNQAMAAVLNCRRQLESYIADHPSFLKSFTPLPHDPLAPPIVQEMLRAAALAHVGPMAAVAGAVAQAVGRVLRSLDSPVIVENGGDCYLDLEEAITIGLYAGPHSPFSNRVGLRLSADRFPLGVCTSSGTVGHSVSLGKADGVTIVARDAALADAAATAIGNLVQSPEDISSAIEHATLMEGIDGVVILVRNKMGAWGNVELVPL